MTIRAHRIDLYLQAPDQKPLQVSELMKVQSQSTAGLGSSMHWETWSTPMEDSCSRQEYTMLLLHLLIQVRVCREGIF